MADAAYWRDGLKEAKERLAFLATAQPTGQPNVNARDRSAIAFVLARLDEVHGEAPAGQWGVWCVEDRAWCMTGTRVEAERALPDWASGRAADVNPKDFHYEIRPLR